jgi:hypothetical protein
MLSLLIPIHVDALLAVLSLALLDVGLVVGLLMALTSWDLFVLLLLLGSDLFGSFCICWTFCWLVI